MIICRLFLFLGLVIKHPELSVLIPLYAYDCSHLLEQLHEELHTQNILYEVIVLDDASPNELTRTRDYCLRTPHFQYHQNSTNQGRAKTRNHLSNLAQGEYLLFIDGDCEVQQSFIRTYLNHLPTNGILIGGHKYADKPPANDYALHYQYGLKREVKTRHFTSSNFLIPKSIMEDHPFDEAIRDYGHEDSLLGLRLSQSGIKLKRINNPVIHLGLDENSTFLHKQLTAVRTLKELNRRGIHLQSSLEKASRLLKALRLDTLSAKILHTFSSKLENSLLHDTHKQLWKLDLLKLKEILSD